MYQNCRGVLFCFMNYPFVPKEKKKKIWRGGSLGGKTNMVTQIVNGLLVLWCLPNWKAWQLTIGPSRCHFFFGGWVEHLNHYRFCTFCTLWLRNERPKLLQQSKRRMEFHTVIMCGLPIWSGHNVYTAPIVTRNSWEFEREALVAVTIYGFNVVRAIEWFPRTLHWIVV